MENDLITLENGVRFNATHYGKVVAARIILGLIPPNSVKAYKEYLKKQEENDRDSK